MRCRRPSPAESEDDSAAYFSWKQKSGTPARQNVIHIRVEVQTVLDRVDWGIPIKKQPLKVRNAFERRSERSQTDLHLKDCFELADLWRHRCD